MDGEQQEPQSVFFKAWRRIVPARWNPPADSRDRLGQRPLTRRLEHSRPQSSRNLSLGRRPSVEPPHVFDYQFARSPAPSATPSIASYHQQRHPLTPDRAEELGAIPEVDTPPRTSLDSLDYSPSDAPEQATDQTISRGLPPTVPGHQLGKDVHQDGSSLQVEPWTSVDVNPTLPEPDHVGAFSSQGLGQDASEKPVLPQEFQDSRTGIPRSSSGGMSGLAPPVSMLPEDSASTGLSATTAGGAFQQRPVAFQASNADANCPVYYNTAKPTCSLNLVCYRSGANGCDLQQIQCALRSNYPTDESFQAAISVNKYLVYSDDVFFKEMQRLYKYEMCGFFRRYFSLKSLRAFRVLAVSCLSHLPGRY